jgi:hypothetical protein
MDDVIAEIVGTRIPKLQDFKLRKDGKLLLILSLSDNDRNIISLNETAAKILSLCNGHNNINTIAQTIATQHNAEFKIVRNDTLKLIRSLEGAKIVNTNL